MILNDQYLDAKILFSHKIDIGNRDINIEKELQDLKATILEQKIINEKPASQNCENEINAIMSDPIISKPKPIFILTKMNGNKTLSGKKIGLYTVIERQKRIRKYKEKLAKWREDHPVNRNFEGRRRIAFEKQRINGRFIKNL